jgi:hypothetical protein
MIESIIAGTCVVVGAFAGFAVFFCVVNGQSPYRLMRDVWYEVMH